MARGLGRYRSAPPSPRIGSCSAHGAAARIDVSVLYEVLVQRPSTVLPLFHDCGVSCLEDLTVFREMRVIAPAQALRVVAVAAMYGIPEKSDDAGRDPGDVPIPYDADDDALGDVLGKDRGEV